jgi:hypothetical protein
MSCAGHGPSVIFEAGIGVTTAYGQSRSLRPDGRLVKAETGHAVQDERPDLVVAEILAYR